jgi:hypothetical protein
MEEHMKNIFKIFIFGILTWIVPIAISIPFYSNKGALIVDIFLFKSIMILALGITCSLLLKNYLKKETSNYIFKGAVVGCTWFIINIFLDIITIVPMSEMSFVEYFSQTGLRYLLIPIMSISMGLAASDVKKHGGVNI